VSLRRWLLVAASFAGAVAAALYVIAKHWPDSGAPLGLPWWLHLAVTAVVAIELFFRGAKIALAAQACGVSLAPGTAVRATLCGDFLDAITPARLGAEPARFLVLSEAGVPVASALLILFLELWLELLGLVAVAAALVPLARSSGAALAVLLTVGGYGTFVGGVGFLAWLIARGHGRSTPPPWIRYLGIGPRGWSRLVRLAAHLREGMGAFRKARPSTMALAVLCSVLHILARLAVLPLLVLSQGGDASIWPLVLWPLALLYAGAIAPVPSGGGLMELGFHVSLGNAIPAPLLAGSLIWWRFYSFYAYVLLGALAAGRTAMRALTHTSNAGTAAARERPSTATSPLTP
jgi:uncharacterized membrane protein YbhN (UPF0104 family)